MITPKAAKKELAKRKKASTSRPITDDDNYKPQNDFVNDPSRYLDAQCSRRAGKTNALAKRYFKTLEKYPGATCIYLALTHDSARDIMWPVLQEIDEKYGIGGEFVESKLLYKHPNGGKIRLYGADMKNFIKRLKGRKSPGIGIDEAQDFGVHLESLINDVLNPMIIDYPDGWLAITGTPGPVPQGYFFQVTQERRYGYSHHAWTLFENPYIPDPHGFVDDLKKKREWDDTNPTLKREWLNQWVLDVQSLWVQYSAGKSHYESLPATQGRKTHYILGIDIGFKDADALAVLAYTDESKETYLADEIIVPKQGFQDLVDLIEKTRKKYDFSKMVIDEGGLGKKFAEDCRRRFGIPVEPADKVRKQANVELLNDHLRRGLFKAKKDSRFAKDSYLVQIDWEKSRPDKIVVKKQPHSDIIDAVLYAFKESPAYAYIKEPEKPKYGSREWAEAQQSQMWEEASKHFQEQAIAHRRAMGEPEE